MADHCASRTDWTDLPGDLRLLGRILQLLELPEALAVAAVCTSWRSATADPRCRTPWLMTWKLTRRRDRPRSEVRNLFGPCRTYKVGLPRLNWCGASHGWLVASDELSNLVLCHPFTSDTIPLPPVTDLECVKGVYDNSGNLLGYRYGIFHQCTPTLPGLEDLGTWFYQKVVLSCDPSHGGDYGTAVTIHYDGNWLSFARAREGRWRLAAEIKVQVLEVDVEGRKLVSLNPRTVFPEQAVFVGLNHSACLPTNEFPGLKSNCVYFTSPRLVHYGNFGLRGSRGVGIYDLENQTSEPVFSSIGEYADSWPTEIWYIPGV